GLRAHEGGDLRLERQVRLEGAADEADGAGAGAILLQALDAGAHHLGMAGQAQVVVRGEDEDLAPALHPDHRVHRRGQNVEPLVSPGRAELIQLGGELRLKLLVHWVTPVWVPTPTPTPTPTRKIFEHE